ncbi:aspartate ammonia-lyase [Neptuniibacter sp. 2_MG-2023]|uniref:class II fumarate hydratase n=1 Tax=Neptuniibacter sp. 2_MG-2023 TaxID=3062671 RepID=UPI0026E481EE|nr:class II fumarate hydratase [Neptuniibacter sp. 2_MG-2023]MDO6512574.1 class II fumarate hydratase [Neptuniibacter sp. 2_MG-2023]
MGKNSYRIENDSLGEVQVPIDAFFGAQTQRAMENFTISDITMPRAFIRSLGLVKAACAAANTELEILDAEVSTTIQCAAKDVSYGHYDHDFPLDVFQTGSGTSTNMNANEVIAHLAAKQLNAPVNPNDQVNMSQSSNDVIPTCIHLSAALLLNERLIPALEHLMQVINDRSETLTQVVKTGRTHLMDAMPVTYAQELSGWKAQIKQSKDRLLDVQPRLFQLAIGGTAVGTGINAPKGFAEKVCAELSQLTNLPFEVTPNHFAALSSQDTAVELSGQLKTLAVALVKISNDLRWANSGPLAGLGEISLPVLQPGSSIMPGKVNPVVPEAVAMAATQVIGNDCCITLAGQSGNFQLNVMLPLVAHNLIQSIELLSNSVRLLADKAISKMTINIDRMESTLALNPILITALNRVIGYEQGAIIAKRAYAEKRTVLEVAIEVTGMDADELSRLLDPKNLT